MLPDDQFATAFARGTERLEAWAHGLWDCADADLERGTIFWRLRLTPKAAGACLVEIIVYPASQTFDFQVHDESYDQLPANPISGLHPLLHAVVAGRVVQRTWVTASANLAFAIETEIQRADGAPWLRSRPLLPTPPSAASGSTAQTKTFLPYRRAQNQ
jgi:hypothetical protein